MFLSDISLKRPVGMTVVLLALGLFGYLAFRNVGVDLMPQVDLPFITVVVVYPGASPEEMETAVARKVEEAVSQVDGLKHITATCANNYCQVLLEFHLGHDADAVATDVREKIDLIRNDLPSGAEAPKVMKYDMNALSVVTMALTGTGTLEELYDYADERLADRFSAQSGVASVELIGGEKREVLVELDRGKIASKGLTVPSIIQRIATANLKVPSGEVDEGGRTFTVMFDAEARRLEELGDIELGEARGERVYLRDVATFSFGTKRPETIGFLDGRPAIVMKVTKKGEANAAAVVARVRQAWQSACEGLPAGMELHWVRDEGDYVNATVRGGFDSIWQGILLTGFILLLFLADWRTALTAFVSIPVTMVIALISFSLFGYTFNMVTMSAIGISTGILVANSIVVLENIAARLKGRNGASAEERSLIGRATGEIAVAVFASALTNVVVFLPMAAMKTMVGRFFVPFAIVVTAATFASLLVSFTLTPMLTSLLGHAGERLNRALAVLLKPWDLCYRGMAAAYRISLRPVVAHPWLATLAVTAATAVAFRFTLPGLQMDFIPQMDKGELTLRLEYPADYSLGKNAARTKAIADKVAALADSDGTPVVRHLVVSIGKTQGIVGQVGQGAYLAEITLVLKPMDERRRTLAQLAEEVRKICRDEADVSWAVMAPNIIGGSGQSAKLNILGDDLATLNSTGLACARQVRELPSCVNVEHSVRAGRPEMRVTPKRAVLNDIGTTPQALGVMLRGALTGLKPATFTGDGRSYDIRVRMRQEEGVRQLPELNLPGPEGRPFMLDAVADFREVLKPVQIVRTERRRSISIYADNAPGYGLATTLRDAQAVMARELPPGYEVTVGGVAEFMDETFDEFGLVTTVAIILAYLLLCAIMESWGMPFVIMFTVPFAYLGMFLAIRLTGTTFSIFGLLAGIMLVGVVVNAAILLIDDLKARRATGTPNREAILEAAAAKFRPILMSCAAALFGMLPMALGGGMGSELRTSIGIGSVGGLLVSSLVSLYFIPALCALRK